MENLGLDSVHIDQLVGKPNGNRDHITAAAAVESGVEERGAAGGGLAVCTRLSTG